MKSHPKGFTLIEMLAAMVIAIVVGSLTYQIIGNMADIYAHITARNQLTSLIRQVDDRLVLEMRQAATINTASAQAFEFVTPGSNTVRYEIASGQLQRQLNGGTARTLVPSENLNTTGSGFTYYYPSMTAYLNPTNLDSIKSVMVTLNLVSGSETYTLNQHILLENRRGL